MLGQMLSSHAEYALEKADQQRSEDCAALEFDSMMILTWYCI